MGEASPFSLNHRQSTETIRNALQQVAPELQAFSPLERQQIELVLNEAQVPMSARAALDVALHDWLGKRGTTAVAFVGTGRHCANFGHNRD